MKGTKVQSTTTTLLQKKSPARPGWPGLPPEPGRPELPFIPGRPGRPDVPF